MYLLTIMNSFRPILFMAFLSSILIGCNKPPESTREMKESKPNWTSLFNGRNLDGWMVKIQGHPLGENWNETFRVVDGNIRVDYSNYDSFNNSFGHLFYKIPYNNYRLKLSYRFIGNQVDGGENWAIRNSGVMIHCQAPKSMELDQNFPVCLEVQLLGGISKNESRSTGNLCTPGTHVKMDDELISAHCIASESATYYHSEWVNLEVEVQNDSLIRHYINGNQVLEYNSPVIGGEYNTLEELDGSPLNKGFIALQSESHPIEFKNIMLLDLNQ